LKGAGHSSAQLLMDLLPIVIIGSVCALLLVWRSPRPSTVTSAESNGLREAKL
jgi:hypothetical protein